MIISQNKTLKIILIIILLFLVIFQALKCRNIINKKELLQSKISAQQLQVDKAEAEYLNESRNINLKNINQNFDFKEKTAVILSELKSFDLKLIDFSSSKSELNLNLSGKFNAVLDFIYYLETEIKVFKIEEFKIKKNSNKLFFYLKLKNELI